MRGYRWFPTTIQAAHGCASEGGDCLKELFEQVIQRKDYDLKSLLTCIDQYHIEGKLTDDERQELTQAAREGATAEYDYAGEINALWAAVRELQKEVAPA